MTITSLAILFAAISVATTITMVQAEIDGNDVTITITSPAATPTDFTVAVADAIEYNGVLDGVDALVTYTDNNADMVITDRTELKIDNPGVNLSSGDTFTFTGSGASAIVTFTDGVAPGTLDGTIDDIIELAVTNTGAATVTNLAQESITGADSELTVDIDASNEVWIELPAGPGTLDDIVITIDTISWTPDTGAIGAVECTTSTGTDTVLLFDANTLQFTLSSHDALGDAIAVHCDFTPSHGSIDKVIVDTCILEVKKSTTQECTFKITYDGARATIVDTISAGWEKDPVIFDDIEDDGDTCSVDGQKNKKTNNKSATGFTCDDVGISAEIDVTITTRESPGQGHGKKNQVVFKPTTCSEPFGEPFDINSGAKAILLDDSGDVVLGTLDGKPIVLDSTDFLSADVVDNTSADPDILCSEA